MVNLINHPTNFMINFEHHEANGKHDNLQDCVNREHNYDLSFVDAWKKVIKYKDSKLSTAGALLGFLDKIHNRAINHLYEVIEEDGHVTPIYGRAAENCKAITKNLLSDEEGIKDIIKKIWIDKMPAHLIIKTENPNHRYIVSNDQFYKRYRDPELPGHDEPLLKNDFETSKKTIDEIYKIVLPLYRKRTPIDATDASVILGHQTTKKEKAQHAIKILNAYCENIQSARSEKDKIKVIAHTIRDLAQLRLYHKGNARSLFMMANFLFYQNNVRSFYPRNMNMFLGNSVDKMMKEISVGQDRFAKMFGSEKALTTGLAQYKKTVVKLRKVITSVSSEYAFDKAYTDRNFNFLLRLSASKEQYFPLLQFLLVNRAALNIDISSKGQTSGTALDIATKSGNAQAIDLLKQG